MSTKATILGTTLYVLKLNADQLKALEEFLAIKNSHDAIYSEETFRQGVAFGVKFTAEVFLLGE